MRSFLWRFFDNIESYFCRALLSFFVILLFIQILAREFFGYSISWSEELATYTFAWFVFFGASYAAKMSAHNRVTFQFKLLPAVAAKWLEALSDLVWLIFNGVFIYLSYDFVFNKMNLFWKSQTLGVPMKYIYMVLPLAFTLMSIRVIQVNYYKLVKGVDVKDPDKIEVEAIDESELTTQKK
ncbi:TRAP transporter small permease [Terasakiella sp. A23]|uniref:TRAP transporter small permease n=1 Tax=Terasakiella sp. FCG-A23 TaxID=3080561 RepID=UPI00295574CE|nr:TRAP transporter small permease [Terasakiella sp. A23]MDV7341747.1 TRAP transporter small permease [Terasakiella sp. A23]